VPTYDYFLGLKFLILIDNEDCESVTRQIEENGGLIVDSFRQADHVVTTYGNICFPTSLFSFTLLKKKNQFQNNQLKVSGNAHSSH
jgi:hypothetical protein